jgi:hypothetical protein
MPALSSPVSKITSHPQVRRARKRYKWARLRASFRAHQAVLGNPQSGRKFSAEPPVLSDAQRKVLEDLKANGIATATFQDLFGGDPLWDELATDMAEFTRQAEEQSRVEADGDAPQSKDQFLIRRGRRREKELKQQGVKPPFPRLPLDDAWLRYAMSGPILDIANSYRGMWTKLIDMDQWYTVPYGTDYSRVGSQNWHRDPEDLHVLKVFTYFSDVDEEAGPFQYIPGSAEGGRYGHLWPWQVTGETYPSQEELAEKIPESEFHTAMGPRGSIIFCDTSGFHRGGFAKTKPRVMSYHTFVSPASHLSGRKRRRFFVDLPENGAVADPVRFALS